MANWFAEYCNFLAFFLRVLSITGATVALACRQDIHELSLQYNFLISQPHILFSSDSQAMA